MTDWMDDAACRAEGVEADWWSDVPGLAKHVCQIHCPVRAKCDAWAEDGQWMALVVGGYLRSNGSTRSGVQPTEVRDGCQTCKPGTRAPRSLTRSFDVERAACQRCARVVPLFAHGEPMNHKHNGEWCR